MIRVATFDDLENMVSIFIDAYNFHGPRDAVRPSMEISLEVQPDGCLLALVEGKPVGMGCIFLYKKIAWIGLMGVKKDYQRRGIGTAIFRRLLEIGKKVKTIRLDASSQGYGLYRKFNFVDEYRTVRFRLTRRPLEKVSNVEVLTHIPEWMSELDEVAFGDDRRRVLEAYLRRGAKIVTVENEGFGMVYRDRIGPLIAETKEVARKILLKGFSLGAKEIIVPTLNEDSLELIKEFKPMELTRCTRMRFGPKVDEKIEMVYGILAYAKG
ncbi:hypothetical protein PNA2_0533 [Pyrococcus sp. NA2]|uniref:GNAT family N-acetyltransferase n=1 Tax=Pyrococcus sp. (strain NA2) TaxID=342949 RepID=UPI000209AB3F|nr:GNAT family N-acetyltransferase [Pyrococcus sp. NA2]AEC51449.1 hypothetical protein PNA2_0533 [Pyrococcus sp. NA2]